MRYEFLVALNVTDEMLYQKYREQMAPILKKHGGGFGYDFKVSEVLKSEVETPINRVFTIFFASEEASKAFFSHDEYQRIKAACFEKSVSSTTIISRYPVQ